MDTNKPPSLDVGTALAQLNRDEELDLSELPANVLAVLASAAPADMVASASWYELPLETKEKLSNIAQAATLGTNLDNLRRDKGLQETKEERQEQTTAAFLMNAYTGWLQDPEAFATALANSTVDGKVVASLDEATIEASPDLVNQVLHLVHLFLGELMNKIQTDPALGESFTCPRLLTLQKAVCNDKLNILLNSGDCASEFTDHMTNTRIGGQLFLPGGMASPDVDIVLDPVCSDSSSSFSSSSSKDSDNENSDISDSDEKEKEDPYEDPDSEDEQAQSTVLKNSQQWTMHPTFNIIERLMATGSVQKLAATIAILPQELLEGLFDEFLQAGKALLELAKTADVTHSHSLEETFPGPYKRYKDSCKDLKRRIRSITKGQRKQPNFLDIFQKATTKGAKSDDVQAVSVDTQVLTEYPNCSELIEKDGKVFFNLTSNDELKPKYHYLKREIANVLAYLPFTFKTAKESLFGTDEQRKLLLNHLPDDEFEKQIRVCSVLEQVPGFVPYLVFYIQVGMNWTSQDSITELNDTLRMIKAISQGGLLDNGDNEENRRNRRRAKGKREMVVSDQLISHLQNDLDLIKQYDAFMCFVNMVYDQEASTGKSAPDAEDEVTKYARQLYTELPQENKQYLAEIARRISECFGSIEKNCRKGLLPIASSLLMCDGRDKVTMTPDKKTPEKTLEALPTFAEAAGLCAEACVIFARAISESDMLGSWMKWQEQINVQVNKYADKDSSDEKIREIQHVFKRAFYNFLTCLIMFSDNFKVMMPDHIINFDMNVRPEELGDQIIDVEFAIENMCYYEGTEFKPQPGKCVHCKKNTKNDSEKEPSAKQPKESKIKESDSPYNPDTVRVLCTDAVALEIESLVNVLQRQGKTEVEPKSLQCFIQLILGSFQNEDGFKLQKNQAFFEYVANNSDLLQDSCKKKQLCNLKASDLNRLGKSIFQGSMGALTSADLKTCVENVKLSTACKSKSDKLEPTDQDTPDPETMDTDNLSPKQEDIATLKQRMKFMFVPDAPLKEACSCTCDFMSDDRVTNFLEQCGLRYCELCFHDFQSTDPNAHNAAGKVFMRRDANNPQEWSHINVCPACYDYHNKKGEVRNKWEPRRDDKADTDFDGMCVDPKEEEHSIGAIQYLLTRLVKVWITAKKEVSDTEKPPYYDEIVSTLTEVMCPTNEKVFALLEAYLKGVDNPNVQKKLDKDSQVAHADCRAWVDQIRQNPEDVAAMSKLRALFDAIQMAHVNAHADIALFNEKVCDWCEELPYIHVCTVGDRDYYAVELQRCKERSYTCTHMHKFLGIDPLLTFQADNEKSVKQHLFFYNCIDLNKREQNRRTRGVKEAIEFVVSDAQYKDELEETLAKLQEVRGDKSTLSQEEIILQQAVEICGFIRSKWDDNTLAFINSHLRELRKAGPLVDIPEEFKGLLLSQQVCSTNCAREVFKQLSEVINGLVQMNTFTKGTRVFYTKEDQEKTLATVDAVHHTDGIPYYTVKKDGCANETATEGKFLRPLVRFEHIFAQPEQKAPKNRSATDSTNTRDLKRTKTPKATQKHGRSPTDSTDTRDHKRTKTLNNRSCDPGVHGALNEQQHGAQDELDEKEKIRAKILAKLDASQKQCIYALIRFDLIDDDQAEELETYDSGAFRQHVLNLV